jgi:hypothetical protein
MMGRLLLSKGIWYLLFCSARSDSTSCVVGFTFLVTNSGK